MPPQVRRVLLPRQTIYRRVYPVSTVAERTALLHATALEAMRLYGTDITQRMYLVESAIAHPQAVAFCAAVPPESEGDHVVTLPATPALSLYHHGAYEDLPAAAKKLRAYARRHGLTPTGKLRRIYLEGPPQHKDPAKFVTQVALPLEEEQPARSHVCANTSRLLNSPLFCPLEKPASKDAGFSISAFRTGRPSRGRSSPAS